MHYSSLKSGEAFSETYGGNGKIVIDVGGRNVNGSLRVAFTEKGMKYICIDMEEHKSVDIVCKPGEKLPFENGSIDLIISTSCFEHDPCFWITFREMTRVLKPDGYIYINVPAAGPYHCFPGDNWRFYSDAGQALAYWSGYQLANEEVYPVRVVESFHIWKAPWYDYVCVWEKTEKKETDIIIPKNIEENISILEKAVNEKGLATKKTLTVRKTV